MLVMVGTAFDASAVALRAGATLTRVEQDRAEGYRSPQARTEFVGGHLLARLCVSKWLGTPSHAIELEQRCAGCGGPHGKPRIVGAEALSVSISHSGGIVATAVTGHPSGVGVDIEMVSARAHRLSEPARRRVLTAGEYQAVTDAADPDGEFLKLWVRKEALIKVGQADLDSMSQVKVQGEDVVVGGYRLFDFAGEDHVGAIASAVTPTYQRL